MGRVATTGAASQTPGDRRCADTIAVEYVVLLCASGKNITVPWTGVAYLHPRTCWMGECVGTGSTETFGHDKDTHGIEPNVSLCCKAICTPATGYVALLL